MNKIEIDKLEAGSELDVLIAEHVMGWKWYHIQALTGNWLNALLPDGAPVDYLPGKIKTDYESLFRGPHYSTDIAAAWQVVEKMCLSFWRWFEMAHRPSGYMCNMTGNVQHTAYAPTAPLAICKAALMAMQEQVTP